MLYRKDIDGLRAIAVMAVVFYHFGISSLSGGYAGVDVFFVISGFLITSILISDVEAKSFTFLGFYEKRIRRLFPALFVTIGVSFVAAYFIFMPDEFNEFAQSMVGASTYLSNLFFWFKSDYFAGPSELKPLLHTWSLSVEEQFYLIFPFIVWATYKISARFFIYTVAFFFVASFLSAVFFIDRFPSAVFFLSPFRFWELLLGSLVAILMSNNSVPNKSIAPYLSHIGLTLIIVPFFILTESSSFPGWSAAASCLGTGLVIWANNQSKLLDKLLTLNVMQFTGKISYSLYLWHWPIVVFYGYWIIRELLWWDTLILLAVTFIVSWVSWRYLETPFRLHRNKSYKPKAVYLTTIVSTGVVILAGFYVWKHNGLPDRFPQMQQQLTLNDTHKNDEYSKCFIQQDKMFDEWDANSCILPLEKANKTVLIWGDSHAFQLLKGLIHHQQAIGANIIVYASAGCSPLFDTDIPGNPQCRINNDNVKAILVDHDVDSVIMAGNWAWAFKVKGENVDLSAVSNTYNFLESAGYKTLVVNQVPIYSVNNPQFLAMRLSTSDSNPENYYLAPNYGSGAAQQISQTIPRNSIFNPRELFCPQHKCLIYRNRELMVTDNAHLSPVGSRYMVGEMLPKLTKLLAN